MDRSRQADVVLDALQALEGSLAAYGGRAAEAVAQLRGGFESRCEALRDVEEEALRELERRRAEYDEADEEDDVGGSVEAVQDAKEQLAEIRGCIQSVESHKAWFEAQMAGYRDVLSRTVPAARRFLTQKVNQLEGYGAIPLDGTEGVHSGHSRPPETLAEAYAAVTQEPADSTLRGPLPKGFRWVPFSDVDLARNLDGVAGPGDFKKVPYAAMVGGFERLRNDILPVLRNNPDHAKDHFREVDRQRGHGYSEGLLQVYEAFFGQGDYIYFARRPDGTLDLINGRHRVKVAHDLGWDAVPAQVRE